MKKQYIAVYLISVLVSALLATANTALAEDTTVILKCSDPAVAPGTDCQTADPAAAQLEITGLPSGIGSPLSDLLEQNDTAYNTEIIAGAFAADNSYTLPGRYYTHGVVDCDSGTDCHVRIPVIIELFPGYLSETPSTVAPDFTTYYEAQGGAALFGEPVSAELQDGYLIRYDDVQLHFPSVYQVFQAGIIYQTKSGTVEHAPIGTWLYARDLIQGTTNDAKAGILIGTVRSASGSFVGDRTSIPFIPVAYADDTDFPAVKGAVIKAINPEELVAMTVTTDLFGEFLLKVLPDDYTLSVSSREYLSQVSSWTAVGGQVHMTDFLLTLAEAEAQPEIVTIQADVVPPVLSGLASTAVLVIAGIALLIFGGVVIFGLMGRTKKK